MVDDLTRTCPLLIERCEKFTADKGFDDGKFIIKLWDEHGSKLVIDIRNLWHDKDPTQLLDGDTNVAYDYKGIVYCYCPSQDTQRKMAFGGFKKQSETLKYCAPAVRQGIDCQGKESCPVAKMIRI